VTRLLLKLSFSGLRRRRLHTALTIVVVAAASAALTLALGVGRVADRPWERTFAATNGAHVTAFALGPEVDLEAVTRLPGVVAASRGSTVFGAFRHDGERYGLRLVETSEPPPEVVRPVLVEGDRLGRGDVLLEQSFARFHDLGPGDELAIGGGPPLRVAGVVAIAAGEAYPQTQPGVAFALEETLARVEPDRSRWQEVAALRLTDPEASGSFIRRATALTGELVGYEDWRDERTDAAADARTAKVVLVFFALLLLLTGGFVLATLVGGRVLAQVREVGLLKAAGLTPGQIGRVFVVEQLALGAVGVAIGIAVGTLATPLFVTRSAALLNASETPSFDLLRTALVVALVLGAVAVFTLAPAWHAGRRTTAAALAGGLSGRAGRSRLGRLAHRLRLPAPIALGAGEAFARPGRATLTALALALTVVSAVATLGMEASLRVSAEPPAAPPRQEGLAAPAWDPVDDDAGEGERLRPIVYGLDAVLLFIGLVNLVATLLLGLRERVRDLGILKALGLTPGQVTASFVAAQALLAALAVVIGIPAGLALFRLAIAASGSSDEFAYPEWWWLALLAPATLAVVAALAAPLAGRAASLRVVDALRYE
jgi:putative ABC transport system permease protein